MKSQILTLSSALFTLLVVAATGCASSATNTSDAQPRAESEPVADSSAIPVRGAPSFGSSQPLVSISVFVDPAEPDFEQTVEGLIATVGEHDNDLRLVIHPARGISQSGFQAWKLLQYHHAVGNPRAGLDFLTDWQATWRQGDPIALAIGNDAVDAESLRVHFDSDSVEELVSAQRALGGNLGYAHGTVVVNGKRAGPNLRSRITTQTAAAQRLIAEETPRVELYAKLVAINMDRALPIGFVDSSRIPIGDSYSWGGTNAPVTVVAFIDLQCPFCGRSWGILRQLETDYGDNVRFVLKHFPLPFHKEAEAAAFAAEAARQQGKLLEFVDGIFENQRRLSKDFEGVVSQLVTELQLDPVAFEQDRQAAKERGRPAVDMELGRAVGVRGTPAFRINGKTLVGAVPRDRFTEIIDAEIEAVEEGIETGRFDIASAYARRVDRNAEADSKPESRPTTKKPSKVEWVPIRADDHTTGPADAPVTIVVFNDLQCPFCKRVHGTIEKLLTAYPQDVRFVFRHKPLPFHSEAEEMAWATIAAGDQGKFWEMHELMFDKQKAIKGKPREVIKEAAAKLGLNMKAFWKVYDASSTHSRVKDDITFAESIGIRGTPSFVINGRVVVGAKPYAEFEAIVKEEKAKADALKAAGTKPGDLYKKLYEENRDNPPTQ